MQIPLASSLEIALVCGGSGLRYDQGHDAPKSSSSELSENDFSEGTFICLQVHR